MFDKYRKLLKALFSIQRIEKKIDDLMVLNAQQLLRENNRISAVINLAQFEFKVFSQWGDDGIIQYLINKIPVKNKIFIEFGVENYRESNTRFLLVNNCWKGLVIDGAAANIKTVKNDEIYWRYDLTAINAFVTKENINQLILDSGFGGEIGLLHIDIDGNDYWIWDAIDAVKPDIVIMEYNGLFGPQRAITIPYSDNFTVGNAHYSRLYFGASLKALQMLAKARGYFFAGCNSAGVNAYFIKQKYQELIPAITVDQGYVQPFSRQSRDMNGNLSFLSFEQSVALLKGLAVFNVETGKPEFF